MKKSEVYRALLEKCGVDRTPNRVAVLEIVDSSTSPLTAQEVFDTLSRTRAVNRVTVYRILELLVEKQLLERISAGDRVFRYGMGVKADQTDHPHFFCTQCGNMECLKPRSVDFDMETFSRTFPGEVQKVEIRIDGVCKTCLKLKKSVS